MAADDPVDQSDLKKVKGIGVKVEARLKAAGITNLGQLARTPVNELAVILARPCLRPSRLAVLPA